MLFPRCAIAAAICAATSSAFMYVVSWTEMVGVVVRVEICGHLLRGYFGQSVFAEPAKTL